MKIAVCSDIHDNLAALDEALDGMAEADVVLFCGDFNAPFTLKALAEGFDGPVHVVWGNNDGDQWLMTKIAMEAGNVAIHGIYGELELGGYKVALVHYPNIARAVAYSGLYDLVCYGHDHDGNAEWVEDTLLLNPGELMGRFGPSSYAIVDVETGEAEIRKLPAG
jgi:hypothetical protein